MSHHAIVPNVNVMDDLEVRIARLSDDEKRLFALICRSYLAAVMPDFEYRQTVATISVPVPERGLGSAEFRAVGRIPLKQGWKAAFGAAEPEPSEKGGAVERRLQTSPLPIEIIELIRAPMSIFVTGFVAEVKGTCFHSWRLYTALAPNKDRPAAVGEARAAIEASLELGEVARHMRPADGMKRAGDGRQ